MSQKIVNLPGIGDVIIAKRKGTRNLRLSIGPDGRIRVGIPYWAPYQAGISFALSRIDWIKKHAVKPSNPVFEHGQSIGKSYRLALVQSTSYKSVRSRVSGNLVQVNSPFDSTHSKVQQTALAAGERALKKDAEKLLPMRLRELAKTNDFKYTGIRIKRLRSRWGSCSSHQEITLNYYLIQLPWKLIDYVILHELVHTVHLNHSKDFWNKMEKIIPDVKTCRQEIKLYRPSLII